MSRVSVSRAAVRRSPGRSTCFQVGWRASAFPGRLKSMSVGRAHGQLLARDRDRAARLAVDDRNRAAPAALARDAPVAQAIDGRALAVAGRLDARDRLALGALHVHPVEEFGVEDPPGADVGLLFHVKQGRVLVRRQHHRPHRQLVFVGEIQVALVVRRAAEDGPRAVVHQHEVRDPHRQGEVGSKGWTTAQAGVEAQLLRLFDVRFRSAACAATATKSATAGSAARCSASG